MDIRKMWSDSPTGKKRGQLFDLILMEREKVYMLETLKA